MEIMEMNFKDKMKYEAAKKRVKDMKGFYVHLLVYLFINTAIIAVDKGDEGFNNLELTDFFTAFFWGIGLFAHWASVFGPNLFFGKSWEERKIQSILDNQKREKQKWE